MVISLVGQKGGSGKSTLACALAWELMARGQRVLLVDADPQESVRMVGEVAAEADLPAPTIVSLGRDLAKQLPKLRRGFSHVIIDTPGRHDDVIPRAALMVSDVALVPVGQSALDAWSISATLSLLDEAQALRPRLQARLVVTRRQPGTVLGRNARAGLEGTPLLRASTSFLVAWQEAAAAGQGVTAYAPTSQAAKEARAVLNEVLALGKKGRGRK